MNKDSLGDRIKGYENVSRVYLTRRMPTIIRLDGKAFHTFTKGFQKPFDMVFMKTMWETTKYLCENIMGCKLAYTQSDEITLLLTDYDNLLTQGWFDKNIQKMCSVSASMATLMFNKYFSLNVWDYQNTGIDREYKDFIDDDVEKYTQIYHKRFDTAMFDSRVFILPKEEVSNAFIWRQQDAARNSIQMVGRANFSHKELEKVNCNQIQEKLFQEKGINFDGLPTYQKRGVCVKKEKINKNGIERNEWVIDMDIPIFTQDREYVEKYL